MDHQFPLEAPDACTVKTAAFYGHYNSALSRRTSLAEQLRSCQDYANTTGIFIHPQHMYTDHRAQGKHSLDRTGFVALQQAAQKSPKPFDYVLIEDVSHCPRQFAAVTKFTKSLQIRGVGVRFIAQQLDSKEAHFDLALEVFMKADHNFIARFRKQRAKTSQE